MLCISDAIYMSRIMGDFKENVSIFTKDNIETNEKLTIIQSENEPWFDYPKCLITASKLHKAVAKMTKVEKRGGGTINMWYLNQKISGLNFVEPNIPAYGRNM